MPCEDCLHTHRERVLTNLSKDVRRLSEELRRKDVLLSSYIETAAAQNKKIGVLNSTINSINSSTADTLLWDPLQPRSSSCSTPNPESNWSEVIGKGEGKVLITDFPPPPLYLSNRYTALTEAPDHPGEDGRAFVVPDRASTGASPDPMHQPAASPPAGASSGRVGGPDGAPSHNTFAAAAVATADAAAVPAPTITGPCSAPCGVGESSCGGPGSSRADGSSRSPSQHLDRGASWSEQETSVRTVRKRYLTSEVDANYIEVLDKCPPNILPASCNFIVEDFNSKLKSSPDSVDPLKTKLVQDSHITPWRNEEIKKMKRNCRIAERRWRKNKLTINYQIFHEQLKIYNNALRHARNTYFANIIDNQKNNPRVLFSTIDLPINPDFNKFQSPSTDSLCEDFAVHFRGKVDGIRSDILSHQNTVLNTSECLFLPEEALDSFVLVDAEFEFSSK
ncbi:hypothetical protein ABVT39_001860 [Epinephelus coioides]